MDSVNLTGYQKKYNNLQEIMQVATTEVIIVMSVVYEITIASLDVQTAANRQTEMAPGFSLLMRF